MTVTTLYVDVENLQDIAKQVITCTIAQWPKEFPQPDALQLYVRADQMQLWHIWTSHQFPSIKITIKGVQRYGAISKNLADISLTLDALADFLKGRTSHIAILSDDSDYVSLFTTIKQEMPWNDNNELPFIWFLTDRPDSHSRSINEFLPSRYLHTVIYHDNRTSTVTNQREKIAVAPRQVAPSVKQNIVNTNRHTEYAAIAQAIIQRTPVGSFRSTDCMKIVKSQFPNNHISKADNATFGNQFAKNIWPILEKHGVRLPNPDKKPRKYEMTDEAKKSVTPG